ncbi:MAG: DUF2709 domain-containing protein [Chlamydiales bacterium]|nr:DUF2709 domain-containing protein [Chlamydiia bacterium]MCP5507749.1 DUF2709 domain-containing protein [Chlamydiales bacterium]
MTTALISEDIKNSLQNFLGENTPSELINTYLFFIEKRFRLKPVLFPKHKVIYQSAEDAIKKVEDKGELYHEAEIKISFSKEAVNDHTRKIYICPFTGKVFGDNTHPNPQDAIYDWVSKCPENTERSGGLRVKRFFVSEDPEVIKSYMEKQQNKEPITKTVYSSVLSGKIFASKQAVIDDFKKSYLKPMTMIEVQNQNRYEIEGSFLDFIQGQLVEEKVAAFLEAMAEYSEFRPHVERWLS